MFISNECPFYRYSDNLNLSWGMGYCDLDCNRAACDGRIKLCEKPDALTKYFLEQKMREESLGRMKRTSN